MHDPFAQEIRKASVSSEATTTAKRDSSKTTTNLACRLDAKEPKRPARPRKEPKKSRHCHREEDLPTQRSDNRDSDFEGNVKVESENRSGPRSGKG